MSVESDTMKQAPCTGGFKHSQITLHIIDELEKPTMRAAKLIKLGKHIANWMKTRSFSPPSVTAFVLAHKELITVTSEALAALGIIAAGTSFTYDSWKARQPSLTAAIIYSTPSHISLLVSNDGGQDLVVQRVTLHSGEDIKSNVEIDQKGLLVEKGKSSILSSSRSKLNSTVQYKKPEKEETSIADSISTDCEARIEYIVAGEDTKTSIVKFQCHAATLLDEEELMNIKKMYNLHNPPIAY